MGLSDGLFAIAMTLLILNIEVPDLTEGRADDLAGDLAALDTTIYVWLLSLAVLALLWRRQHVGLDRLRSLDGVVVVLNFALLALVSAIPFSSDLFGEYSGQPIAVAIYAANVGLASLVLATISCGASSGDTRSRASTAGIRCSGFCRASCSSPRCRSPGSPPRPPYTCGWRCSC